MVFIIDQDVTSPSDPSKRVQFLHWYEPNLSGASEVLFASSDAQNATSAPALTYVPPTPPGGDIAHEYTVIMFNQPKGFSIPSAFESFFQDKSDLSNRLDFDIAGFVAASGLGSPVGANWFQVQNTTEPAGGSGSGSTTSSSSAEATTTATSSESSSTTQETITSTSTTAEETSTTSESTTTVESTTTTPSVEPSTSTQIVTASQTFATSSLTPSASASITPASGNGAGPVDVYGSLRALALGLLLSVAGAGMWRL